MKQIRLSVPFPGFTRFINITDHSTGWETTHYLVRTVVSTDVYGKTQTVITTYDQDNGSIDIDTTTDSGYVGVTGTVDNYAYTATTLSEDWHEEGVEAVGGKVTTLSSPYYLDDLIDTWRTRFDAIIATEDLLPSTSFTARKGLFGTPRSGTTSKSLEFASLGLGGYQRLELSPWKGWLGDDMGGGADSPGEEMPWDETYYFRSANYLFEVEPNEYDRLRIIGMSPGLGDTYSTGALPLWDGTRFSTSEVNEVIFIKSCLSLPTGMSCDQTAYTSTTNYEIGDIALLNFDYSTGYYTQAAGELELRAGFYSFDGRVMVIHSGGKINPSGTTDGIDGSASPFYGQIAFRTAISGDPHTDASMVTDYCPP